jgi:hypothetical protein
MWRSILNDGAKLVVGICVLLPLAVILIAALT